jgi:hypothetical protein
VRGAIGMTTWRTESAGATTERPPWSGGGSRVTTAGIGSGVAGAGGGAGTAAAGGGGDVIGAEAGVAGGGRLSITSDDVAAVEDISG